MVRLDEKEKIHNGTVLVEYFHHRARTAMAPPARTPRTLPPLNLGAALTVCMTGPNDDLDTLGLKVELAPP